MDLSGTHDVVVVGSGAGGAAAAWRLCTSGAKVLLLEAGPQFDPSVDYRLTEPGWERRGFPAPPGSRATISFGDLGALDPAYEDLRSWSLAGSPARAPAGARRAIRSTGYMHVQGIGGSTLHFVGEAHRLHQDAFRMQAITGQGAEWPIAYADLAPYYEICENLVGVAGDGASAGRARSGEYPLAAHPLSPGAAMLRDAGARIGQDWQVNPRAALSAPYRGRAKCNYCAQCSRGCPIGDKGSADVTYIREALATGNMELVTNASATRIELGADGNVAALHFVRDNVLERVETPILVVAAGAVETPRLLLLSKSSEQPDGMANGSGEVGRNFMETLSWLSSGLVPGLKNSHMGLPDDAICLDNSAPGSVIGMPGGYRLSHSTHESGLTGPLNYATRLVPGFGRAFKRDLRDAFGSALTVGAVGQVIPDERSQITLDSARTDRFGNQVAQISSVLTGDSLALLRVMAESTRAVLVEAGAKIGEELGSWDHFAAPHVFGTARMGADSEKSVVGPDCRAHDHGNLWICDASVFPTSGGGEAPSLTISALAARAADAILSGR